MRRGLLSLVFVLGGCGRESPPDPESPSSRIEESAAQAEDNLHVKSGEELAKWLRRGNLPGGMINVHVQVARLSPSDLAPLSGLLLDPDPKVRGRALSALEAAKGLSGSFISPLAHVLTSSEVGDEIDAACSLVKKLGPIATALAPALIDVVRTRSMKSALSAAAALGRVGDSAIEPVLRACEGDTKSDRFSVFALAILWMGQEGTDGLLHSIEFATSPARQELCVRLLTIHDLGQRAMVVETQRALRAIEDPKLRSQLEALTAAGR